MKKFTIITLFLTLGLLLNSSAAEAVPTFESLTPSELVSGAGVPVNFTTTVADSEGAGNISKISFTLKEGIGTRIEEGAIGLEYEKWGDYVWLRMWDPDTGKWRRGECGSEMVLENNLCLLDLSRSSVENNGEFLNITWNIVPKITFFGEKRLWITSIDFDGNREANVEIGSWNITQGQNYTLTVQALPVEGGITDPSPGTHLCGENETVMVTAIPNVGYRFQDWSGDVIDSQAQSTSVILDSDKEVTARFVLVPTYTLSVSADPAEGGFVDPAEGDHTYSEWETVALSATALPGYRFSGWSGDVSDPEAQRTEIIIDSNKAITAHFDPVPTYMLSVSVDPVDGGSVDPAEGDHAYSDGAEVALSVLPATGYRFMGWDGDLVTDPTSPSTTITMDANHTLIARFEQFVSSVPTFESLTPSELNSSVGETASFSLASIDIDGVQDIRKVMLTIKEGEGTKLVDQTDLGIEFYREGGCDWIQMFDNVAERWRRAQLGSSIILENDLCYLDLSLITIEENGDELIIHWNIIPKETFTGNKRIWTRIRDWDDDDRFSGTHVFLPLEVGFWTIDP